MRFHELHEKYFMPYWRSTVHKNDDQAVLMHFVFLSQVLGTLPLPMAKTSWKTARTYSGMRVAFNGEYVHPKLHLFVIGGSGSGKGVGQKALKYLFTTFNIYEFARRYNIPEPLEDNIWQALENQEGEFRKAKWERRRVRKKVTEDGEVEDLSQEPDLIDDLISISERKEQFKDVIGEIAEDGSGDKPFASKPALFKPYKMPEHERREIKEAFRIKSGKVWSAFTSKNFHVWPAAVKSNTSTTADLVGGFSDDKSVDDGKTAKQVWVPGYFQTHALLGYDEARSILSSGDSDIYALFCGALDDSGDVETKARKDRDEYGNVINYQTFTSMITGTTLFNKLSSFVASGGFLQRFILYYRDPTLGDMKGTARELAMNKSLPADRWNLAVDYYKFLNSLKINYGEVGATDAARERAAQLVEGDYDAFGKILGYGNHTFNMATGFMNRRMGFYFKIAAIMAALDGLPQSTPEHFEAAHKLVGEPCSRSIAEYLENCFSASEVSEVEQKAKYLNMVLRARVASFKTKGWDYVPIDRLAKDIAAGVKIGTGTGPDLNGWVSENKSFHAIRKKIFEWAYNRPDTVSLRQETRHADGKPYVFAEVALVDLPEDVVKLDAAIKRDGRDKRVKDQGGVRAGWGDIVVPKKTVVEHDEDDAPSDNHDAALDEIRKKKQAGG